MTPETQIKVPEDYKKKLPRDVAIALETCVRCGLCTESCHYYKSNPKSDFIPAYRAEVFRRILRKKDYSEKSLGAMSDIAFSNCTLCRRCVMTCPLGVDTGLLMREARGLAVASGTAPEILVQLADTAISRGEDIEIFREMFLENIKALEEEVRQLTGDPQAVIPVDKKGADILFVALSGAHSIIPPSILFHYAKANWTLSFFEASNYGVLIGDKDRAKRIVQRIVDEAKRLGVKEIVVGECGHAYNTLRWEAPKWFDGGFPFRVRSIIEVMAHLIQEGRLPLDKSANPEPVIYHDACNLTRNGGLLEEPRIVLRAAVKDYREMSPNRDDSYCCGGGGGIIAVPEWDSKRMEAGKPKAEQIKATGAKVVIVACDNCRIQINDLNEHYKLGINIGGITETVVKAILKAVKGS
ncbi:MAG: (Fe-S)-binding protein [Dehalococcoidales bacterium]|nr:(Fe-S)-binding protein [Dehalococcoidales bacterium]